MLDVIAAERVRELLDYAPQTGAFTWKKRLSRGIPVGAPAGCIEKRTGYRIISIDNKAYQASRLAWIHFYGEWPKSVVRFQNNDHTDCRIENLRDGFMERTPDRDLEISKRKGAYTRRYRAANPDTYRAVDLKRRFGITLEEFKRMEVEQGGVCAICGKPETIKRNGKDRWLAVDHCHNSNKVRGLLCGKCNPMIGYSQDDPAILDKAAAYLRRHAAGEGGPNEGWLSTGTVRFKNCDFSNIRGTPLSDITTREEMVRLVRLEDVTDGDA